MLNPVFDCVNDAAPLPNPGWSLSLLSHYHNGRKCEDTFNNSCEELGQDSCLVCWKEGRALPTNLMIFFFLRQWKKVSQDNKN